MALRMNPTPLNSLGYSSSNSNSSSSSSSIMTSENVDVSLLHDDATLSADLQSAVNATEDVAAIVAEVREELQQSEIVVEADQPHNAAVQVQVQQQQSADGLQVSLNPVQLQQEQAAPPQDQLPPIIPQPAAAADVHFVAGADDQEVAGAGRIPWRRRLQNQVRRLGTSGDEPDQVGRRTGTRQIRRPRKYLDCVVPYFCSRKP